MRRSDMQAQQPEERAVACFRAAQARQAATVRAAMASSCALGPKTAPRTMTWSLRAHWRSMHCHKMLGGEAGVICAHAALPESFQLKSKRCAITNSLSMSNMPAEDNRAVLVVPTKTP